MPKLRAVFAGLCLSGLLALSPAALAFCGFFVSGADAKLYNNASQVVLMRKGNHTVMTLSNNYKGPPEDFAMVVPVPVVLQKEQVKTLSPDVFKHIDELSAPRLVEYWEQDPCRPPMRHSYKKRKGIKFDAPEDEKSEEGESHGVKIEAKFEVGEYQILILSAKDSSGLETWLRENKYTLPQGAAAALAPYVRDQMKFFVAKVDIKKVQRDANKLVVLSPLRFGFDAAELRLPVRLGLLNADSKQDLLIYVLSPESRYEVANYPNVFVPTNLEVADAVRKSFGPFYASLFDETLRKNNNTAVITEYSWQTTSCDPCPTPPLDESELAILGDEQIFSNAAPKTAAPGQSSIVAQQPYFGAGSPWILTRMHTRYDRATLSDDLIFRAAKPVYGGRADDDGGLGDSGAQVEENGVNNFQGRYIIRHYWEAAVSCKNPRYGIWGGPSGKHAPSQASAATDLANAPRGQVKLSRVVETPVPSLGLPGKKRALRPGEKRNAEKLDE